MIGSNGSGPEFIKDDVVGMDSEGLNMDLNF